MPLMSIIGCMENEKKIARILAEDKTIEDIIVVGDSRSTELVSDLEHMGVKPKVMFPETLPPGLKKSKNFNVLVTLQDNNDYKSPNHLKSETYEKIKFYGPVSNGVLMFPACSQELFRDAGAAFHNSKFLLELLTDDGGAGYLRGKISECLSASNSKKEAQKEVSSSELDDRYRGCYNKLKDMILTHKTNS